MEKIIFNNGTQPYINDTNLNQMQDNIENEIDTSKTELENQIETSKTELENQIKQNIETGVEFATNEYIDGNRVYRKRVNCGALPNSGSKTTSHNLTNPTFVKIEGYVTEGSYFYPIPYVAVGSLGSTLENSIGMYVNQTQIGIVTARNINATAVVDLYYTKTE